VAGWRKRTNHASIHSTIQRFRPRHSLLSMPRRAICGVMLRARLSSASTMIIALVGVELV
jgi:hypothetical protein